MNKKGIFNLLITIVLVVLFLWVWAILQAPALEPSIDAAISDTSGAQHADGIEFFLRMLPWVVPFLFVLGLLWVGVLQ